MHIYPPHTLHSQCIEDLNIKPDTPDPIEEKVRKALK